MTVGQWSFFRRIDILNRTSASAQGNLTQERPGVFVIAEVWYGLFMHFCDSNHEITRMQQEENQRSQIDFMLMTI